ncbi:MarR family transcriptional regulator [Candidatus Geothermarchaeota archaeon ex4572_27]|nr:MAG: MarR family transcriptional regulator [Candidatus Geothermarchaeota archaeon ex4572_27]
MSMSDIVRKILETLAEAGTPMTSKEIAEKAGLTAKEVGCRIAGLKKRGWIESPEKGKYVITDKGREALKGT